MNRPLAPAIALATILVLPFDAQGQSAGTDEGVAAFVQGDYARAIEILKPAAERWQMPYDNTAALFMALIYDNGLGVAADPVKACALTLRTLTSPQGSPLALTVAVQAMSDDFGARLGPDQMARCRLLADIGIDRPLQRSTFTLAPGHWITIEFPDERREAVAQIEYAGKASEHVLSMVPTLSGVRYLFAATELTSLRPRPERRQFLEAFAFLPTRSNRWTLMWFVFEILRDQLAGVTFDEIQIVDAEQPPADSIDDLRRFATVRVNADGDAEWAVLAPDPGRLRRSDVIELEAERREVAAETRARQLADEKFDPAVRRPRDRVPSLTFSDASPGCWDLLAYAASPDHTEAITLRLDPRQLQGSPVTYASAANPDVDVRVWIYDQARRGSAVCDDAHALDDWREPWRAVAGRLRIELTPVFRIREPGAYRATIQLTDGEFVSPAGARVRQSQPITLSTIVRLPQ
jgi:hypothetical protein